MPVDNPMKDFKVNPLTDEHLETIDMHLANGKKALDSCELAERAGVDVSQHKQSIMDSMDRLRKIRQVYFPNK